MSRIRVKFPRQKREKMDLRGRSKIVLKPAETETMTFEERLKRIKEINDKLRARRIKNQTMHEKEKRLIFAVVGN